MLQMGPAPKSTFKDLRITVTNNPIVESIQNKFNYNKQKVDFRNIEKKKKEMTKRRTLQDFCALLYTRNGKNSKRSVGRSKTETD